MRPGTHGATGRTAVPIALRYKRPVALPPAALRSTT